MNQRMDLLPMSKEEFIKAFIESATKAARENSSEHPEDIAYAMSFAIESTAPALTWIHFKDRHE